METLRRLPLPEAKKAFGIELRAAENLGIHAPLFGRRTAVRSTRFRRMESAPVAGRYLTECGIVRSG